MRKFIALGLLAAAVFAAAPSHAAECAAPVSTNCTVPNLDGTTTHCDVYFDVATPAAVPAAVGATGCEQVQQ
ncbi:MAG: hypothetical protein ACYDCC_02610 [Actinomycetota bacterium]